MLLFPCGICYLICWSKFKEFERSWFLKSIMKVSPCFDGHLTIFCFLSLIYSDQFAQCIWLDNSKRFDFWKQIPEIVTLIVNKKMSVIIKSGKEWMSFWKWISLYLLLFFITIIVCISTIEPGCDDLYLFSREELPLSGLSSWGKKKVSGKPIPYFYAVHIALWHICIEFY